MTFNRRAFIGGLATLAWAGYAAAASSAPWPARPITLVVAYPAGGDTDAVARMYAEKLSVMLGQPVVVDNKPGAGGMIGHNLVAKAKPDGYTLLMAPNPLVITQHVLKVSPSQSYDPVKDFSPIVQDDAIPLVLITNPSSGIKSVADLVKAARANPDLNYASPGNGSPMHVVGEMLNRAAGIKLSHVPYRGTAPVITDALGGHVTVAWVTSGAAMEYVRSGRLIALATASPSRIQAMPSVPTLSESGYDIKLTAWQGLLGPKDLPADIVARLNKHMNDILKTPEVRNRLLGMGIEPVGGSPADFGRRIAEDNALYGRLTKEYGIRAD